MKSLTELGIGRDFPTFFIAEIGSNFDGSKQKAFDLIGLAADAGADAVKFQHYTAGSLVNPYGFSAMQGNVAHQKEWSRSVFDTYDNASLPVEWTAELAACARNLGIHFFTSPYSFELVDEVDPYLEFYKIGSGDITHLPLIEHICSKQKPVMFGTGAATLIEIQAAIDVASRHGVDAVIMQCNTNYSGDSANREHINLNVLSTFSEKFPDTLLGISDHMTDNDIILAAIAMGARVVERHFTDNTDNPGPDHLFSMDPETWRSMIARSRALEGILGRGEKVIEKNERETVIVQRRSICLKESCERGHVINSDDIEYLRPCPPGAFSPADVSAVLGRALVYAREPGHILTESDFA